MDASLENFVLLWDQKFFQFSMDIPGLLDSC